MSGKQDGISGSTLEVDLSPASKNATLTLTGTLRLNRWLDFQATISAQHVIEMVCSGPSDVWFGFGFGRKWVFLLDTVFEERRSLWTTPRCFGDAGLKMCYLYRMLGCETKRSRWSLFWVQCKPGFAVECDHSRQRWSTGVFTKETVQRVTTCEFLSLFWLLPCPLVQLPVVFSFRLLKYCVLNFMMNITGVHLDEPPSWDTGKNSNQWGIGDCEAKNFQTGWGTFLPSEIGSNQPIFYMREKGVKKTLLGWVGWVWQDYQTDFRTQLWTFCFEFLGKNRPNNGKITLKNHPHTLRSAARVRRIFESRLADFLRFEPKNSPKKFQSCVSKSVLSKVSRKMLHRRLKRLSLIDPVAMWIQLKGITSVVSNKVLQTRCFMFPNMQKTTKRNGGWQNSSDSWLPSRFFFFFNHQP